MIIRVPALAALSLVLAASACGPSSEAPAADAGSVPADAASMSGETSAAGAACAPIMDTTPTICSMTQPARNVIFTNNCSEPVDIWWVDYTCAEVFYHRLTPGTSYTQGSFVTHPWRARSVPPGVAMGTAKGMLIKEFGAIPAGTTDLPFMVP